MRITAGFRHFAFLFLVTGLLTARAAAAAAPFSLKDGDRVLFLGDALAEGEQRHGWIETMLTTRFADRAITFRNLGWNGDNPAGDSRAGLSLLQAGHEPDGEGWTQLKQQLVETKPTVAFIAYGMASSLAGAANAPAFKADVSRLLDALEKSSPGVRVVLLGPIRHEALGAPWPDPAEHNRMLARYADALRTLADERRATFVSLFDLPAERVLTTNGIQLNDAGYRRAAERIEDRLLASPGAWRNSPQAEPLRQAIRRKNEWYFHRSRPGNMAYIFGFRKREQGRNAGEMNQFDAAVAAEENRIAQLRTLPAGTVPEIPRRIGNLTARHTAQPRPHFEVADGFEVTLWAENPMLDKPIHMNFDPRGRLWVASSELYPQIEPGQAATDKIIVLADTTGAGRADQATVFADGLLIPTGVAPGDGGVYVAQSTELLYLKDNDGDGRADERRVVLGGFGTEDTHHNLHTLRWGPDGRLYMNQSTYTRSRVETPHGVVALKGGGVFRFDPRDERLEIIYRGWANPWGHQFDDFGQPFVTDGAGFYGVSWAVPGASYLGLRPGARVLPTISTGTYPKFCGLEIVRSRLFPADWQDDLVTCDFRAHRVVRFKRTDQGAGYATREMPEVIRTTDVAFRPIDVKLGPDGALYVADWSNPIIQHGEVDFRDPRRDKEHGRIWRIAPKGRAPLPIRDLTKLGGSALLDLLVTGDRYDNEQARRVLVEHGQDRVGRDLAAWTAAQKDESARLQALLLYRAYDESPIALRNSLLTARDPNVRAGAVRALPAGEAFDALGRLVADENPRVRLEAVRALGRFPRAEAAGLVLSVIERPMDPFLDYAVWLTINELAAPWIAAVKSGAWQYAGRERQLEFGLKSIEPALAGDMLGQLLAAQPLPTDGSGPWIELIGSAGRPRELRGLFERVVRGELSAPTTVRALTALREAARLRNVKPEGDFSALAVILDAPDETTRIAATALIGQWKLATFTASLLQRAGEAERSSAERAAALVALREAGGRDVLAGLRGLADATPSAAIRRDTVVALASLDLSAALPAVIAALQATGAETESTALWRAVLGIHDSSAKLAAELPRAGLPVTVARAGLRPAREGGQNSPLVPVLLKLAGLALPATPLSSAELQQLGQEALARGDPARGERIYRRAELACLACHAIGGAGGKIGPDLTSIGASAPVDYLVESLLYPSAKIKEGYHAVLIATQDRREISGMVVRETAGEIVLRDGANQEISIPLSNIAQRTSAGSLMPPGLIDGLLPEERLDLVKFLSMLGRPGDYDAARGGVARSWKIYVVTNRNQHLGIEAVVHGDFSLKDWVPSVSLVRGTLTKEACEAAYPPKLNTRGLFAAARFESARDGTVNFSLVGEAKEIWVNGTPVKPKAQFSAAVRSGPNVIVLQLDDLTIPEEIRLSCEAVSFGDAP